MSVLYVWAALLQGFQHDLSGNECAKVWVDVPLLSHNLLCLRGIAVASTTSDEAKCNKPAMIGLRLQLLQGCEQQPPKLERCTLQTSLQPESNRQLGISA